VAGSPNEGADELEGSSTESGLGSEESKKKLQSSEQKSTKAKKSKGIEEDGSSESGFDSEEKVPEGELHGTKELSFEIPTSNGSRQSETKDGNGGFSCCSISSWKTLLKDRFPRLFGSRYAFTFPHTHQNGFVKENEHPKNFLSNFRSYQRKLSSYSAALVIRAKFLILALFWLHVASWFCVSLLLGLINVLTFFAGPWSLLPIVGWGLVVLLHLFASNRLFRGAGQSDLEWAEARIWEYVKLIQGYVVIFNLLNQEFLRAKEVALDGYHHVQTKVAQYFPRWRQQKISGQA